VGLAHQQIITDIPNAEPPRVETGNHRRGRTLYRAPSDDASSGGADVKDCNELLDNLYGSMELMRDAKNGRFGVISEIRSGFFAKPSSMGEVYNG
jgi:hypothetical protein